MITELTELGHKMKEQMKATQSETRQNIQGTNNDGKETRTEINGVGQKEETFNQNRMKKEEFKKTRRGLGTSRISLNITTSES